MLASLYKPIREPKIASRLRQITSLKYSVWYSNTISCNGLTRRAQPASSLHYQRPANSSLNLAHFSLRRSSPRYFSSDQQTTERKKSASQEAKEIVQKSKDIPVKENIRTLPNFLTLTRLLVSPVIGYLILNENYKVALATLCYAGFTDVLDGYIARQYNMRTTIGTIIDPAADKMLMTIMTVSLAAKGLLPTPLAIIILARDAGLVISFFYDRFITLPPPKTLLRYFDISISSAEVRPTLISKVNTALQLALVGVTLCTPAFNLPITLGLTALQYTVAATTIWSGLSYVFSKDVIRVRKPPGNDSDDPVN